MKQKHTFGDNISLGAFTMLYGTDVTIWEYDADKDIITSTTHASCQSSSNACYGNVLNMLMSTITDGDGHQVQHFDYIANANNTDFNTGILPNEHIKQRHHPCINGNSTWQVVAQRNPKRQGRDHHCDDSTPPSPQPKRHAQETESDKSTSVPQSASHATIAIDSLTEECNTPPCLGVTYKGVVQRMGGYAYRIRMIGEPMHYSDVFSTLSEASTALNMCRDTLVEQKTKADAAKMSWF